MQSRLTPPTIDLVPHHTETPIRIDLQAFLDFSFEVSEGLLDLEARHANGRRTASSHKVSH